MIKLLLKPTGTCGGGGVGAENWGSEITAKMGKLLKDFEPLAGVVLGVVATGGFGGADRDGTLIGFAIP